jgi:hypothetical protein
MKRRKWDKAFVKMYKEKYGHKPGPSWRESFKHETRNVGLDADTIGVIMGLWMILVVVISVIWAVTA